MSLAAEPSAHYPLLPSPASRPGLKLPLPPIQLAPRPSKQRSGEHHAESAAPAYGGLWTPPADIMSTTYHYPAPHVATYDNHVSAYSSNLHHPQAARVPQPVAADGRDQLSHQYPVTTQQQVFSIPPAPYVPVSLPQPVLASSSKPSRPSTPSSGHVLSVKGPAGESRPSDGLEKRSSHVPAFIDPKCGLIADFAAQMTCLFWFEPIETLRDAEKVETRSPSDAVPALTKYAKPDPGFKKWVAGVLSTTQVTQNVIMLALLFIYRLKVMNPAVRGRPGSEYRLLTVALMLGNKFLDDNTYTNKTWAEVSSIKVTEIHVMEVEFLSNMRYSLLAKADEWDRWLSKLRDFVNYCSRSGELPLRLSSPAIAIPSPSLKPGPSPLPSPTALMPPLHTMQPLPAMANTYSPSSTLAGGAQMRLHTVSSPLSISCSPTLHPGRKRSLEEDLAEHPTKRPGRLAQAPLPSNGVRPNNAPPMRLPVPNLTLNTNTQNPAPAQYPPVASYPTQNQQGHVSLPPLGPGVRAMATVYPATTLPSQASQPLAGPVPVPAPLPSSYGVPHDVSGNGYRTPTKRHSPNGLGHHYGSSPLADNFTHGGALHTPIAHTPISHSPSAYLENRPSPYKPVRHVNTLLYPPPANSSFQDYHMPLAPSQMHYQPLGRRNDLRTGVVPEFAATPTRTALLHHQHAPSQGRIPWGS